MVLTAGGEGLHNGSKVAAIDAFGVDLLYEDHWLGRFGSVLHVLKVGNLRVVVDGHH